MHDELTAVDIRKMQEEIDYRTSEVTPKLKEQLKAARDLGDLSENDEYHSVRRALNKYGETGLKLLLRLKRADNRGQNIRDFDRTAEYDRKHIQQQFSAGIKNRKLHFILTSTGDLVN